MKICLVHEDYQESTNYSGLGTYNKNLSKALSSNGYDVTVITKSDTNENIVNNGVKIIKLETNNYLENVCEKLRELQDNGDIDIIQTPAEGANTIRFEKYRKVPLIVRINKQDYTKEELKMINCADKTTSCTKMLGANEIIPSIINNININEKKDKSILFSGTLNKEILEFAKNIELILEEVGNIKINFIGKDTKDNDKDISTIEYIKKIVPSKYHKNLNFIDPLKHDEILKYYNTAQIGVFYNNSKNIPYSILESMSANLPFVSSENNGLNEYLEEKHYLANKDNLAERIISLYMNSNDQDRIAKLNKEIIEKKFSPESVIPKIIKLYKNTINQYSEKIISKLFTDHIDEKINNVKKIDAGKTNFVYSVTTDVEKYIVKIYKKQINEKLIKELTKIAENNDINIVKPIGNKFYKIIKSPTCIYKYVAGKQSKNLTNIQIEKLTNFIKLDKTTNIKTPTLIDKVDFYYESLRNMETKMIHREYIDELLKKYMKLKNYNIFNELEIVHGDLSPSNIIWTDNSFTLLDFDEAILSTKLYDLVVLAMNYSRNNDQIDINLASKILKPFSNYTKIDIINVWNFYILKVILENIYLYEIGKIDLMEQSDWENWYSILNSNIIEEIVNK